MPALSVIRRGAALVTVCAALTVTAACGSDSSGSDSGSAPSQSDIVTRLQKEPQLNELFDKLGSASGQASGAAKTKVDEIKTKIYPCFAKALQSSAPADKLRAYVDGDQAADKVLSSSQRTKFASATKSCLTQVVAK